jgi:hypothetical protein
LKLKRIYPLSFFIDGKCAEIISSNDITGEYRFEFGIEINGESDSDIIEMVKRNIENGNIVFFD